MTVCAPNSGKWPTIVEAMNYYDKGDSIFETISKIDKKTTIFRQKYEMNLAPKGRLFCKQYGNTGCGVIKRGVQN